MYVSMMLLGTAASITLAVGVAMILFPAPDPIKARTPTPVQPLALSDSMVAANVPVVEALGLGDLVFAALLGRAGIPTVVQFDDPSLHRASTEIFRGDQEPIVLLAAGAQLPCEVLRKPCHLVDLDGDLQVELSNPRRQWIGSLLRHFAKGRKERGSMLYRIRTRTELALKRPMELQPCWVPDRLWALWHPTDQDFLDASITNRVLGLRASDRKLVEGLVSCVRAGGGEVVLGTVSSRRPRIVLPKRGCFVRRDISGVDPGDTIIVQREASSVELLCTSPNEFSSDQHPGSAATVIRNCSSESRVRIEDAITEAIRLIWGDRSFGATLRGMTFFDAFEV